MRSNPKARQTKSKARLDRYEEMFTTPVREENLGFSASIYIPPGPRLGDIIIEAKGVCKSYGDKQLMKDVDFSIPQGTSYFICLFFCFFPFLLTSLMRDSRYFYRDNY